MTRAIRSSKSTCTPWTTASDFLQVGQNVEVVLITKRNIDDTMMGQGGQRVEDSDLLTTTGGTGRNKYTGIFTPESTRSPQTTSSIPEGLPLSGEVTITSGDTKQESIVVGQVSRADDRVV
ncbi:hypothetical protein AWJ20_3569 [Sugiyamaella lignohabitans]|uniref:Uncharacterized protein n=1 Tax=Sugiyamaella lignohabitans TaxID=796027 RepID=A0A167G026_9ASCO|nr:uncharacterized protein AWJ20_3569 [Sugiyamaella lignohabitans]ANB15925.1 hypothetical protein AWJ20_3569 [Sugiyamaella lignohabitans]